MNGDPCECGYAGGEPCGHWNELLALQALASTDNVPAVLLDEYARLRAFRDKILEVYGGNYEPEGRLADLSDVIEGEFRRLNHLPEP